MVEVLVVNASPLIVLARAGLLPVLAGAAGEVLLPDAVAAEVLAGPASDPARTAVAAGWGRRVPAPPAPATVLEWGLGAGETAVLATALDQRPAAAALDDGEARMCARTLGVPVLGSLGLVLQARRDGRIDSAVDAFRALRRAGLWFDDGLAARVLRAATDETWAP